jgi:hypothetical protein
VPAQRVETGIGVEESCVTTASTCAGKSYTQLSTNQRALTNQFEFPQLYEAVVVEYVEIGKYEF